MKRLLAVVAAIAMIVGALYIRGRGDGDGGDGPSSSTTVPGDSLTLACISELADVCRSIADANADVEVQVEDAGATADALVADPSATGYDAWLTLLPLPQVVEEVAAREVFTEPGTPVAQSRLGIVIWRDREEALRASPDGCPRGVDWRCLGDVAGRRWIDVGGEETWGDVRVAHAPPSTAAGLLLLGHAATGYFGTPMFAANDFELDDGFRPWLSRLESDAGAPSPLSLLLQQGVAAYAAVGATEAEITTEVLTSRDSDKLDVLYPDPQATAYVVLAPVVGGEGAARLQEIMGSVETSAAFVASGWRPVGNPPVPSSGLPNPGVLVALRSLWEDIVG